MVFLNNVKIKLSLSLYITIIGDVAVAVSYAAVVSHLVLRFVVMGLQPNLYA